MNVGESDEEASACELCERDALNDSGDRRPQGLPEAYALAAASASSAAPATPFRSFSVFWWPTLFKSVGHQNTLNDLLAIIASFS